MANELMIGSLYKALRTANVPDDEAMKAASDVASFEGRLGRVEADLTLLKWMVGTAIAVNVAGFALLARMVSQA